jgi:hypothetical protein
MSREKRAEAKAQNTMAGAAAGAAIGALFGPPGVIIGGGLGALVGSATDLE